MPGIFAVQKTAKDIESKKREGNFGYELISK